MDDEKVLVLSEKFVLKRDRHQMWVEELVTVKAKQNDTEKPAWKRVTGYFNNFKDLTEDFAERRFRTVDAKDVKDLLKQMTKIESEAKTLCKQLLKVM